MRGWETAWGQKQVAVGKMINSEGLIKSGQLRQLASARALEMQQKEYEENKTYLPRNIEEGMTQSVINAGVQYLPQIAIGMATKSATVPLVMVGIQSFGGSTAEGILKALERGELQEFIENPENELVANTLRAGVNVALEKVLGVPGQIKFLKNVNPLTKPTVLNKALTNVTKGVISGSAESVTEYVQGRNDIYFDKLLNRFDSDEELAEAYNQNRKNAFASWLVAAPSGTAAHTFYRKKAEKAIVEGLSDTDMTTREKQKFAEAIVQEQMVAGTVAMTKAMDYSEQLQNKHGEVYNAIYRSTVKAMEDSGGFTDWDESSKAQYASETAGQFADQAVAEAVKRNTSVENVIKAKGIKYLGDGGFQLEDRKKARRRSKKAEEGAADTATESTLPTEATDTTAMTEPQTTTTGVETAGSETTKTAGTPGTPVAQTTPEATKKLETNLAGEEQLSAAEQLEQNVSEETNDLTPLFDEFAEDDGQTQRKGDGVLFQEEGSGRGRGYVGYSMSVNMAAAQANNELPASKAAHQLGVPIQAIREVLPPSAWHHASSYYNKVDVYDINPYLELKAGNKLSEDNYSPEEIAEYQSNWNKIKNYPKPEKGVKQYYGNAEWIEWGGTRTHPKPIKHNAENVLIDEKGSFYTFHLSNGETIRKKIGSNGTNVIPEEEIARKKQHQALMTRRKEILTEIENNYRQAYETYQKGDNQGKPDIATFETVAVDTNMDGTNYYVLGQKPANKYKEKGLRRIHQESDKFQLQEWDGEQWQVVEEKAGTFKPNWASDMENDISAYVYKRDEQYREIRKNSNNDEALAAAIETYEKGSYQSEDGHIHAKDGGVLFQEDVVSGVVDLTDSFKDIQGMTPEQTAQRVEAHLNDLIGKAIDTATAPLQVQVTKGNKAHVVRSNLKLTQGQTSRHNAAIITLEKIINNAVKNDRDGTVDFTHNKRRRTLAHKRKVEQYVYFDSPIRINNQDYIVSLTTEQVKGQDPNLLDLYNIHVKRGILHTYGDVFAAHPSLNTNIPQSGTEVKPQNEKTLNQKSGKSVKRASYDPNSKVIKLLKDANASSLPHEFAHYWLDNITAYVNSGQASEAYLQNFYKPITDWLGLPKWTNGFSKRQHEQFAAGYERYLRAGNLPTPILGGVFNDYDKWLKEVYKSAEDITISGTLKKKPVLTPEIINFFRSMTTGGLETSAATAALVKEADYERIAQEEKEAEEAARDYVQTEIETSEAMLERQPEPSVSEAIQTINAQPTAEKQIPDTQAIVAEQTPAGEPIVDKQAPKTEPAAETQASAGESKAVEQAPETQPTSETQASAGAIQVALATEQANRAKTYADNMGVKDQSLYQAMSALSGTAITLEDDVIIYTKSVSASTTFTFNVANLTKTDRAITFELYLTITAANLTMTFPSSVSWLNGIAPSTTTAQKYLFAFRSFDNGTTWIGNLQGSIA